MNNENQTKQSSGLPSRPLIGSTAAVQENAERLADKIIQALREEGFDAFYGGYYDISKRARPIIIKAIVDNE